jgi:hypothetical protein
MPKINDYLQAFQDGLPGMKDYRHASRLYIDDLYKLMPKQKFMYHVVFDTNESLFINGFGSQEKYQMDMLVKACELPRYGMNLEEKIQYNKKMYNATRIQYEPVNITFHDDHADTTNAFWKKYYEYYIADSLSIPAENNGRAVRDSYYNPYASKRKYGLDTPVKSKEPYLRGIEIFVLHKQRFTSMSLVNPTIGSFAHDNLDQTDGAGIMANTMQIFYESVIYRAGTITRPKTKGFANINYDKEPSPLTILGGGTNSIFGPGGIVDGVGSVIKNVQSGNLLGAILSASNTYNNAKKMKKKDVKEELKGIAKKGVLEIGKQSGTITNPVSQFAIGAAVATGLTVANKKGTNDNQNKANTTVINANQLNTVEFLTADESYKLITDDATIKDEIAAGIYYKDIGSRKNLTVAESNVEFENASDTVKTVYRSKANTDIRKLVTEGYLKISRSTQDVSIATEKASL